MSAKSIVARAALAAAIGGAARYAANDLTVGRAVRGGGRGPAHEAAPAPHEHDLRHRRVTTWLAEVANPVHVKEAVGHSDLRTTMGYTHLAREHLKSLVAAPEVAKARVRRRAKQGE